MATTLALLKVRVSEMLDDTALAVFDSDAVDEGIRQALDIYSKVRPFSEITTLTLASDTRELDVSSITDLLNVDRVWLPYTVATPEFPPQWRNFEHWQDQQIIFFNDEGSPTSGQIARIFYTAKQTLNGLDSATVTTFQDDDESLIAMGSAAYTVLGNARDTTETVTIDSNTQVSAQIIEWAKARMKDYRNMLGLDQVAETRPAKITVKNLTRRGFFSFDEPAQQESIPT